MLDYTSRRLYHYDLADYVHLYGLIALLIALLLVALIAIAVLRQRAFRLDQEEKMRRLVEADALTGTLSMYGFRKRVEGLLREHPDIPYLIAYSNVRNFKFINDSLGRTAGDDLLRYWCRLADEALTDV